MVHLKINQSEDISVGFSSEGLWERSPGVSVTFLKVWAAQEGNGSWERRGQILDREKILVRFAGAQSLLRPFPAQ